MRYHQTNASLSSLYTADLSEQFYIASRQWWSRNFSSLLYYTTINTYLELTIIITCLFISWPRDRQRGGGRGRQRVAMASCKGGPHVLPTFEEIPDVHPHLRCPHVTIQPYFSTHPRSKYTGQKIILVDNQNINKKTLIIQKPNIHPTPPYTPQKNRIHERLYPPARCTPVPPPPCINLSIRSRTASASMKTTQHPCSCVKQREQC